MSTTFKTQTKIFFVSRNGQRIRVDYNPFKNKAEVVNMSAYGSPAVFLVSETGTITPTTDFETERDHPVVLDLPNRCFEAVKFMHDLFHETKRNRIAG